MIENIKYTPINIDSQYTTIAWTFDFNAPIDIISEIDINLGTTVIDGLLPIPGRQVCNFSKSKEITTFVSNWNSYVINKLQDIFYEDEIYSIFKTRWPISKENFIDTMSMHTAIFRDPPQFSMGPHLDNQSVVANVIINLKDNDNSTRFHNYQQHDEIVYNASGKTNTGIIFLNTPGSLHSVKNNLTVDRYILYSSVLIKNNWF